MKDQIFPQKNEASYEKRNSQFVQRLRYCRGRKGVTQADISSILGVTKSTISLWENGDTIPDAKSIAALADYYDVSCDFLLCKSNSLKGKNGVAVDELGLNEKTIQVLEDNTWAQQRESRIEFLDALITDDNFQNLCDSFAMGYSNLWWAYMAKHPEAYDKMNVNTPLEIRGMNMKDIAASMRGRITAEGKTAAKAYLYDCIQYFSAFLYACISELDK